MDTTARYYRRYSDARLRALVFISVSILLFPLSIAASLVAIPTIADDLEVSAVLASWIPAAFVLSSLVCQLPGGRLADLVGLKRAFVWSNVFFVIGGIGGALSPTIEVLLTSRVLQGAAGAVLASTGMAILSRVYESKGRGQALGWMTSAVYLGMTSGPLVGGWLVDMFGWRAVFFVPAPVALGVVLCAKKVLPGEWISSERHPVDWVGSLIFALALAALFVGATHLADLSGAVIFASGGMLLYLFVHWNNKANFPLVRLDLLLQNTRFIRSVTAALFMYGSQYGIVLMMALYLQYNRGLSPTEAGQLMMLQALMMTVCAPIAGRLSDRLGRRILATTGSIAISVGLMLLTQMDGQMPLWMIGVAIMIIGTGHGLFSTPNNSSALAAIPSARVGIGSAIISLARQSGQLMGTAVISLLLAIYFDGAAIRADDSKQFETVAHLALYVSLGFALCAAWFSWKRDPA